MSRFCETVRSPRGALSRESCSVGQPMDALEIAFICLSALGGFIAIGYLVRTSRKARSQRPVIAAEEILFQESFASGRSLKNLFTRAGGANNCLRLVITKELLLVTSWFPFSLISPHSDLEHVIPRGTILSVEPYSAFRRKGLQLAYTDAKGESHSLQLFPRDLNGFLRALGFPQGERGGD